MKKIVLAFAAFLLNLQLFAQAPDWSSQIASVIYNHCSSCHRDGGIAPFPLMSYDDAVTHATSIQSYVNARLMPPWPADPECGPEFVGYRGLDESEIAAIDEWVNNGTPSGNLANAPAPPSFNSNSQLNDIDDSVLFPAYTVQGTIDEYRTFVVHSGYSLTTYFNQIEFIIGNPEIVHHILFYYDPTTTSYDLDAADPMPGYESNGTTAASPFAVLVAGWAPGGEAMKLPYNMGYLIPPNSDLVMEIHYSPGSQGKTDSTRVNLKFCDDPNPRNVTVSPLLFHYWPSLVNGPLTVPANSVKTFYEKLSGFILDLEKDYSLFSVMPHMHLIGTTINVYMTSPDNADTTRLVCIPQWDFRWQLGYIFRHMVKLEASKGYLLRAEATYDNTTNNPNNPFNPPQTISVGEGTTNEMMVVFFAFLEYEEGDELIDMNTVGIPGTGNGPLDLMVYPNPSDGNIRLACWLESNDVSVRILNAAGMEVKEFDFGRQPKGMFATGIDAGDLAAGIYLLEIRSGNLTATRKLILND